MLRLLPFRRTLTTTSRVFAETLSNDALLDDSFRSAISDLPSEAVLEHPTSQRTQRSQSHRHTSNGRDNSGHPGMLEEPTIPYYPLSAEATLKSLLPYVPATVLTPAGLASVLFRETARVRKHSDSWRTIGKWRRYDSMKELVYKGPIDGSYAVEAEKAQESGTVVGEVRRMLMKNGTARRKSKLLVIKCVRQGWGMEDLKLPQIAAKKEQAKIEA